MNYQPNRKLPDWPFVQKSANHRSKKGRTPSQAESTTRAQPEQFHQSRAQRILSSSAEHQNPVPRILSDSPTRQSQTRPEASPDQLQNASRILSRTIISRIIFHQNRPPKNSNRHYRTLKPLLKNFNKQHHKQPHKQHYKRVPSTTVPPENSIKHHHTLNPNAIRNQHRLAPLRIQNSIKDHHKTVPKTTTSQHPLAPKRIQNFIRQPHKTVPNTTTSPLPLIPKRIQNSIEHHPDAQPFSSEPCPKNFKSKTEHQNPALKILSRTTTRHARRLPQASTH